MITIRTIVGTIVGTIELFSILIKCIRQIIDTTFVINMDRTFVITFVIYTSILITLPNFK